MRVVGEEQIARLSLKARTASEEQLVPKLLVVQVGQLVCRMIEAVGELGRKIEKHRTKGVSEGRQRKHPHEVYALSDVRAIAHLHP